jgi:hypothetical protein
VFNVKQNNSRRADLPIGPFPAALDAAPVKSVAFRLLVLAGLLGAVSSSAQIVERHSFTNLNQAIPDGNAAGFSDVRTINSAIAHLSSVRIQLRVAGEFNGDLYGYVRRVNATGTNYCVLLNRPGRTTGNPYGYADAGLDVTFAATAANGDIHNYQAITNLPADTPLTGLWQPDGRTTDPDSVLASDVPTTSLASFTGANASGIWTLFLADLDSGATNLLVDWAVELTGTANPPILWPAPDSLTYGTALGSNQLNATSPVAGTFSYSPAAGTVLHAGLSQPLACVFTPADSLTYHSVTSAVSIDVLPHALTITADDKTKFHDAPLPAFTATYSGFVNGDTAAALTTPVAFDCSATAASDAGVYPIIPGSATAADYDVTFVPGTLTVIRILEPISDRMAYVLLPTVVTNRVMNTNWLSYPLTFGLGAGAPVGARVSTNGVFTWSPTRAQARSTNVITIWMRDSGWPPVTATNAFTIVVADYLELMLGQTVLQVGQSGSVPVTLVTTTGLTNLQALVDIPADRLGAVTLTDFGPNVGNATLQQQAPHRWQMDFTAAPGQALQATQELARLSFLALTNPSAFVPLNMEISTNLTTEGLSVWRTLVANGRCVVIEREPLVEALPLTNGRPNLMLYGLPGVSYQVLFTSGLPAVGNWQPIWLGTVPTNLAVSVAGLTNTGPTLFFRAQESSGP